MLQPLQLEGVSARYAEETAELREFLRRMAGVRLDAPDSVGGVAQRLRQDRGFRRDLTSHVWVVLHGAGPGGLERRVGYPELLAMLALAAGGPRYAAMAEDADAHELLRFLMQGAGVRSPAVAKRRRRRR